MATRDYCRPTGKKKYDTLALNDSKSNHGDQYNSINLNQCNKINYQSGLTSANNDSKTNYGHQISSNYVAPSRNRSTSWNGHDKLLISSKHHQRLCEPELNVKNEMIKDKTSSVSKSVLSLHIAAYENSVEIADNSSQDNQQTNLVKRLYTTSIILQNAFETPRQQREDIQEPEIMAFIASQAVTGPNGNSMPTDSAEERQALFHQLTDTATNGHFTLLSDAHRRFKELCKQMSDVELWHIISTSDHPYSIFFAIKILFHRVVQNPGDYGHYRDIWRDLLHFASNDSRSYPLFVRKQFIKFAVKVAILCFFDVVVIRIHGDGPFQEGRLLAALGECSLQYPMPEKCCLSSLTIVTFIDELLNQVITNWRLNVSLPYDHILLIRRCLTHDGGLCFFVKVVIKLGKYVIGSNNFLENRTHFVHLCGILESLVKFNADPAKPYNFFDTDHYCPPANLDINELCRFVFKLVQFMPETDELALQCYGILNRLCYARGEIFGDNSGAMRYRSQFQIDLIALLDSTTISPSNLDSILSLLCNFTCILYTEESYDDSSIMDLFKHVSGVVEKMVPIIMENLITVNEHQIRKILRNFGQPLKYLLLCMPAHVHAIIKPDITRVICEFLSCLTRSIIAVTQDKERWINYKAVIKSILDVGVFFFEDIHLNIISRYQVHQFDFSNNQDSISMSWYFLLIAELMKRSYSEDADRFYSICIQF